MIPELGHYALVLALALGLIQAITPIVGARGNDAALMGLASSTSLMQFAFVGLAFLALIVCYVTSDFSVATVYENAHSTMPLIYKVTSAWGNHEGSMLLWVLILSFFGALVGVFGSNLPATLKAYYALAVQSWIACAFYLFILFTSNPFSRLAQAPFEGRDLNPILQDIGLAIHPPLLYLGYVGFSIAFSFAIAALIERRIDAAWARWVRPWTLAAWMFLTAGIFLTTACLTVLVGTLYPLALEALTGEKISVGAPFFNLTFAPLFIPLVFAMPFGPLMAWKRGDILGVAQRLTVAFGVGIVAIAVTFAATGQWSSLAPFGIGLGVFVMIGAVTDVVERVGLFREPFSTVRRRAIGLPRSA
jgi:cytochrome c biogenesis factor